MSINITVHGSPFKRSTKTKILLDPEGNKKKLLEERRKLRLEQVRQKSKEFACQVRKNVDNEKQKQLRKIEETKKEELKNWKKHLKKELNNTIPEIGEAHRAAHKDSISSNPIFHNINNKESLDLIPTLPKKSTKQTNKNFKQIYNAADKENNSLNVQKHLYPQVAIQKSEDNSTSSLNEMFSRKCSKKSDKLNLKNKTNNSKIVNSEYINHDNQNHNTTPKENNNALKTSTKEEDPLKSYALYKERMTKKPNQNLKKTPSLIMSLGSSDISLSSSTSSLEIQDIHDETNQHFSRIYSKSKKYPSVKNYNPKSFSDAKEPTVKSSRTKFTKISDFLNKNQPVSNRLTESNESSSLGLESRTNKSHIDNSLLNRDAKKSSATEVNEPINSENSQQNTQKSSSIKISDRQLVKNSNSFVKPCSDKKLGSQITNDKNNQSNCNYFISSKTDFNDGIKSYDYNNRFQKNINPTKYTTVATETNYIEPNAAENADIERQLQRSRDNEIELLKKKTEERGQKALEREKVRRDYEMLEAKLEVLTRDKQLNGIHSNAQENFSEVHLKQIENDRINKINKSIENIIKRPVVITLPEVRNKPFSNNAQFDKDELTKGINLANIGEDSGTINSTDSCCSILLNYVDNQTKQINNDIRKSDTNQKTVKLKQLLNKLETLRENLLKELEKTEKSTKSKNIQTMFDSITDLREEREKILLLNSEKKDLEKREKELKKREAILEKKLKEFYDMKKTEQKNNKKETIDEQNYKSNKNQIYHSEDLLNDQETINEPSTESLSHTEETQDESSECIEKKIVPVDKPLEIVIKVKEPKQKTPYKKITKKVGLYQKDIPSRKKYNFQKVSTPVRIIDNSDYTTSTVYKSPPETMRTELGAFIEKDKFKNEVKPTEKQNKNETLEISKEKILKNKRTNEKNSNLKKTTICIDRPCKTKDLATSKSKKETEKNISKVDKTEHKKKSEVLKKSQNFVLAQYIHRLLGMSRHSINMLGVSSSDIQTPNSSVVNVRNNISSTSDLNDHQNERIKRIQNFIDDNYSFVNELEETLKKEEKSACESEESIRLIEEIWKKSLKHKSKTTKPKEADTPKPILKKKVEKKKKESNGKTNDPINKNQVETSTEEQVLEKYSQLTDNCTQRIAELNEMIDRVRKEKQKILEITLSSNSSGNSKTEYLDFMAKSKTENRNEGTRKTQNDKTSIEDLNKNEEISKISSYNPQSNSIPENLIKEPYDSSERVQLEKNKLTGVSRDSGISLSRPLTALDIRDSPDIREKTDEMPFEPFLKDIPKPNTININKPIVINMATITESKQISVNPNALEQQQSIKKNKPPVSISRYSPQLVEDVPHELSTILEIDTPATSRLNVTLKEPITPLQEHEKIVEEESKQQQEEQDNGSNAEETHEFNINFQKYPSFEDYAKAHNMEIEQFDAEKSAYIKKLYEELFELTHGVDISFKKFPSINSFQNHENTGTGSKTDIDSFENISKKLQMRKFLTPKEYFKKIGATDLIDSKSLIDNNKSKSSTSKNLNISDEESSDDEFSKEWCLKKFPELNEYLKKVGVTNITNDSLEKTKTNTNENKDEVTNLTKSDSGESLPDVNAELKRRNILEHSFKNESFVSSSDAKSSSSSNLIAGSSSSKENKDPTLYIKAKSTGDISGIEAISNSYSSNELGKEFDEMGLKWASLMLKKQQQSNALSSSTSSSFIFQKRERKNITPRSRKNKTATEIKEQKESNEENKNKDDDSIDTTVSKKFGKPLNLREFIAQELKKRTSSSIDSTSLTDDSLASLFLRSLLNSTTPSPKTINGNDIAAGAGGGGGSSDRQQKTSTPVLLGLSSSSRKSTSSIDSNGLKLFSGESRISSVRFQSENSSSNDDQDKNSKLSNKNNAQNNNSD